MINAFTAVIHGRVQGVGFRYFVFETARSLGLGGAVANRPDGTVHVVAEGAPDALVKLRAHLERGPALARVERVELVECPPTGRYEGFSIS